MLRKLIVTAALFVLTQPVFGQDILEQSQVNFSASLQKTQSQANQHHRGDHLIFVYDESEKSKELVQGLFADDSVAAYVNEHFAAMAVRANTAEGNQVMRTYSGGGEGPRIIVSAQRLNGFILHQTNAARESFLKMLSAIKEASTLEETGLATE